MLDTPTAPRTQRTTEPLATPIEPPLRPYVIGACLVGLAGGLVLMVSLWLLAGG